MAQKAIEPSKLKQFNITVNFEDFTVKTQMLSHNKEICTDNEKTYMWYSSQKLIETRGGYDGKLIHGIYRSFYLNNQLKEQGRMQYGLRDKEWKYWYPDGKLKEVIHWKNGRKNGSYLLYNDYGQLMAKSRFKKDKLHGKFYTYGNSGAVIERKKYRNGEEVVKRKRSLFKIRSDSKKKEVIDPASDQENKKGGNSKQKDKKKSLPGLFKKKRSKVPEVKPKEEVRQKSVKS